MSIKYGTMAPHKYWHIKLSIVIRNTAIVRQKWP